MRAHLAVVSLVLALATTTGSAAAGQAATDPHVRPAAPSMAPLVAEGIARSETIRALADQLQGTDVVAYVRTTACEPGTRDSSIQFVGRSSSQRFMMLTINKDLALDRQVALLGHELQHAVDMAKTDWITDAARMQQYFTLVGSKNGYPDSGFETVSAKKTERKVAKEIAVTGQAIGQGHVRPR